MLAVALQEAMTPKTRQIETWAAHVGFVIAHPQRYRLMFTTASPRVTANSASPTSPAGPAWGC